MATERDEEAHAELIRDLFGWEDTLHILSQLHDKRLTAPGECFTVSVDELIDLVFEVKVTRQNVGDVKRRSLKRDYRTEILSKMDTLSMIEFNEDQGIVRATPRTTLFYLVVQPHRFSQRRLDNVVSAVAWVAWRYDALADCADQETA